jgi:hypothetical protein
MYCDEHGKPHPDGDFQMMDGKMVLREGRSIRFSMALLDTARQAPTVFMHDAATFTDAERTFADSAEGRAVIARAEMVHDQQRRRGEADNTFTDTQATAAIKAALVGQSQAQQGSSATVVADAQRVVADAAYADMIRDFQKGGN